MAFGPDVAERFLKENKLELLIRRCPSADLIRAENLFFLGEREPIVVDIAVLLVLSISSQVCEVEFVYAKL